MARRKRSTATPVRPGAPREQVFEMFVTGFSIAQIAQRVGYSVVAVRKYTDDPTFREEVAQFQTARRDSTAKKLEAAAETAAVALAEISRGFSMANGERTTIDPSVSRERTRASVALLDRIGFGTTARVVQEGTTTNVNVNRQGPPVSDEDMARLQRLLDPG